MYKKMFVSMYDGSLGTRGPWEALVTFQQMIILADQFGVVDITPEVISRRTGIPLPIIKKGIKALEEPDPNSRSPELDGRRIDRLADHRDWGWRIVNFTYYDGLRRADERAAYQAKKYQERKLVKLRNSTTYKKDSTNSTDLNSSTLSTPHSHSQSELQSEHEHKDKEKNVAKAPHSISNGTLKKVEKPESVEDGVWRDFVTHRKTKKSAITETAMKGFIREAEKAGVSLNDALRITVERGWVGFRSDWRWEDETQKKGADCLNRIPKNGHFVPCGKPSAHKVGQRPLCEECYAEYQERRLREA